ncbi:hypothetical protein [Amycolatopsis tucumanensis]|uniref:Uncharacterized protein n=1 Tax=Amycolatopsis tucumanensis TaxID=401106 RepID=A0ABP7HKX6_9PSEU|nr:hypothetical protein [Amycolatopsis tucumanensis]MCF6423506.1 hypothetical protein [Amycolatopsis tucumanensis]
MDNAISSHEPTPEERHRAARAVAGQAKDADELRELLAMLGLSPAEGRAPVPRPRRQPANRTLTIPELTELFQRATASA